MGYDPLGKKIKEEGRRRNKVISMQEYWEPYWRVKHFLNRRIKELVRLRRQLRK